MRRKFEGVGGDVLLMPRFIQLSNGRKSSKRLGRNWGLIQLASRTALAPGIPSQTSVAVGKALIAQLTPRERPAVKVDQSVNSMNKLFTA